MPSEFDRRVHLIVPTDEGRGLFGKISPVFSRVLGEVFDGLESEEIEAFQNSLQRMVLKAGMADVGAESKLFRLGVA
ncbi:hypothetical protein UU5_14653 [Rhodanobacter sp. 115]|nr:hypothetical protein UU5_14653 [Rhodanobacter sp. 115]